MQFALFIKTLSALVAAAFLLSVPAFAAVHDLGEFARTGKIEAFNRAFDESKPDTPEAVFLDARPGDGLAWIADAELSEGTIELEIEGRNAPGRSFVGLAFHGHDNQTFDAVYLRPFNFQVADRRNHSIQYISMPKHDWSELRSSHPGKYEAAITPAPDPDSWVKLKLVIEGKRVSAFVNGADKPALTVELLNDRLDGKVGLWVGNGSDGGFRNLRITRATK